VRFATLGYDISPLRGEEIVPVDGVEQRHLGPICLSAGPRGYLQPYGVEKTTAVLYQNSELTGNTLAEALGGTNPFWRPVALRYISRIAV
jgi:hypothetical protein